MTSLSFSYIDAFNSEVRKLTREDYIMRANIFVQLSALQKHCLHNDLSVADFLSKIDNASHPTGTQTYFTLPDVMKGVDHYRALRGISKRRLSEMIQMDTGNFMKLYRQGTSINMHTLLIIAKALGVSPSVFMHTCEALMDEEQ